MDVNPREYFTNTPFVLNNGVKMPRIGLGTYKIRETGSIEVAIDAAIRAGYRLFDIAPAYRNEVAVGEALRKAMAKYNLERDDLFIITKLSPSDLGNYRTILAAYQRSLDNLGMEQVDTYLIHFPGSTKLSAHDIRNQTVRRCAWQVLTQMYEEGRVNAIGVSNFNVNHLKSLNIQADELFPAVNQVEWHPHYYQEELLEYCRKNNICIQAYSPFGGASSGDQSLLEEPVVQRIAHDHASTPTQVVLTWSLQQNVTVVPKSANPQHIVDNMSMNFLLSEAEIKALNDLRGKGKKYAWDPTEVY